MKLKLWEQISGNIVVGAYNQIPEWQFKLGPVERGPILVVLDDVWSLSELEELIFKLPGCKTLVISRFKFPTVIRYTYEMEMLGEDEALSLFCHAAFEEQSIPPTADKKLVKQVPTTIFIFFLVRLFLYIQLCGGSAGTMEIIIRSSPLNSSFVLFSPPLLPARLICFFQLI